MLDFQKIKDDWGYAPAQSTAGPGGAGGVQPTGQPNTQPKTSVNKATTSTIGGGTPVANTSTFNYPSEWDSLGDQ